MVASVGRWWPRWADGGACVPRDVTAECAVAECGSLNDGCKEVKCPRSCPGGPQECGVNQPNRCGMPKLCTAEGWCWENPYPQGYSINAAWRTSTGAAWVGGVAADGGAFVARQGGPAEPWSEVPLYSPRAVNGLWGADLPDGGTSVWVVGPRGSILRRD